VQCPGVRGTGGRKRRWPAAGPASSRAGC
jgi:hypothetical protein